MEKLFDLSAEYDQMLNEGLKYSGEDKIFFLKGRIDDLRARLPEKFQPQSILDFGCGIGDATKYLSDSYPHATVTGTDLAQAAILHAAERYASNKNIRFVNLNDLQGERLFDLVYVNGVFHHIEKKLRQGVVERIFTLLKPGGYFALFENNPWNPGTQLVMHKIPFDRDAVTLNYVETKSLLLAAGFTTLPARFLFYFPKPLSLLRPLEKFLTGLPLGAQYYVLGKK